MLTLPRIVSSLLLACALGAAEPAADPSDADLLAAARIASVTYQKHLAALDVDLAHSDLAVRLAAIRILGNLQDPQAVVPLLTYLETKNRTPDEIAAVATALAGTGNPAAIVELRKMSAMSDAGVRLAAYNALGQLEAVTAGDHTQRAKDSSEIPHLAALTNPSD